MGGIVDVDAARVDKVGSKFGASCLSGSRKLARFAASAPPSSQSAIRSTLLYIGTLLAWSPARFPHSASALRLSTYSTYSSTRHNRRRSRDRSQNHCRRLYTHITSSLPPSLSHAPQSAPHSHPRRRRLAMAPLLGFCPQRGIRQSHLLLSVPL